MEVRLELHYGEDAETVFDLNDYPIKITRGLTRYVRSQGVYYVFTGNMLGWKSLKSADPIIGRATINIKD